MNYYDDWYEIVNIISDKFQDLKPLAAGPTILSCPLKSEMRRLEEELVKRGVLKRMIGEMTEEERTQEYGKYKKWSDEYLIYGLICHYYSLWADDNERLYRQSREDVKAKE